MSPDPIEIHLPSVRLAALDYRRTAPRGAIPLLVLHGQADLAWSMHPVASALAHRYGVVSLDLRGHGDSDHPGAYSILHYMADVRAVIEHLGMDRPIIIGHSLGGQITSQLAGLYPELMRAIVLAEGIGPPITGIERNEINPDVARSHIERLTTAVGRRPLTDTAAAAARLRAAHPGLGADHAALLADRGTRPTPDGGVVWKFDPRTTDWFTSFSREVAEARWNLVRCPTLVITGAIAWERWWSRLTIGATDLDPATGPDTAEIARRIACFPRGEHVELADAGHMLQYDQPDALNTIIAGFLDRIGAAT